MAKAAAIITEAQARKRRAKPARPRTPQSDLDRLPQFEPDRTIRPDETQRESGCPFPESRAHQIRDVLSSAMKPHVREAHFQGEPTSLERFLRNAMPAIAKYESRSGRRRAYDRKRASKLVKEVSVALLAFPQQTLERIVKWKQLDRYLEKLFVAEQRRQHDERKRLAALRDDLQPTLGHTKNLRNRFVADLKLSKASVLEALKVGDRYRTQFRARSPGKLLEGLKLLEPLLPLAQQKLEYQRGGDAQRDMITREFADAMVLAWKSATGALPPYSKSKTKPSAFQRLMATINRELIEPNEIRSRTDFQHHAVSAVDRAHKRAKGASSVRE